MEGHKQIDNAYVGLADRDVKKAESDAPGLGATKEAPPPYLLGLVLLLVGVIAFSPMLLTKFSLAGAPEKAPDTFSRNGLTRDLLYAQARQMSNRGEYSKSIEELTRVISGSPRRLDAYFNRGKCYMSMREPRFDLALADFNRAIALDPNDGDLYQLRATVYEHLGNHDMAVADLKKAEKYAWRDRK